MTNGWTPERRARQAALIRNWRPWENSTGPRSDEGKARTAQNGFKGGQWRELLMLARDLTSSLREQRDALRQIRK
jgi:hypothetical protein